MISQLQFFMDSKNIDNIYDHALILVTLISVIGAAVYWFYKLNLPGIIVTVILVVLLYIIILRYSKIHNLNTRAPGNTDSENLAPKKLRPVLVLDIAYFFGIAASWFILWQSHTTAALISPWQAVPQYFFAVIAAVFVVLLFRLTLSARNSLMLLSAFYFTVFAVVLVVFPLGFGFDPFIHQATLDLIARVGSVDPKPLYYLGQYAFLTIVSKLFFLPLKELHYLLIPLLAAVFLPQTLLRFLRSWFSENNSISITIAALLSIPFGMFTITTPQHLAYLLLALVILRGLDCRGPRDLIIIYLLALAALASQAIAGIPALLFAVILTVYYSDLPRFKVIFSAAIYVFAAFALPLALWIAGRSQPVSEAAYIPEPVFSLPANPHSENLILNTAYFFIFNLEYIIIFLVLAGLYIAWRYRQRCRIMVLYAGMGITLFVAYYLSRNLDFSYLIDYERGSFLERIRTEAVLFASPFIVIAIYALVSRAKAAPRYIRYTFGAFLVISFSVSVYASYPRFDRYFNSHSYTVSQADIDAVRLVNKQAGNSKYIVLANQQVSAAALSEFGFKQYYQTSNGSDIFYYPIPTGGPLYGYYLNMVYLKPSRDTMLKAMDLAGVNEAYFVLNKYWWAFDKIAAEAKLEADSYFGIDNDNILVFEYRR